MLKMEDADVVLLLTTIKSEGRRANTCKTVRELAELGIRIPTVLEQLQRLKRRYIRQRDAAETVNMSHCHSLKN